MEKKQNLKALLFLVLTLVMNVFTPIVANAEDTENTKNSTTVNIIKVVSEEKSLKSKTHDGSQLNIQDKFGEGASYINGAQFDIYPITQEEYKAWVKNTDLKLEPKTSKQTVTTKDNGLASLELEDGYYWITENRDVAPTLGVEGYVATDFALGLPLMNEEGTRRSEVYLYPKNTTSSSIDKTVTNLEAKSDGFAVGDTITYWIQAKIPAGELTSFTFTDTLSDGLNFVNPINVQAYIAATGTTDTATVQGGTPVSITSSVERQTATFDLTSQIATLKKNAGKTVYLRYEAVITKDAEIGTNLPNDAKLTYKRDGSSEITKEVENDPVVYTGGKKFKKQDPVANKALEGAEFVIKNTDGKFMSQDDKGKITWVEDQDSATKLTSSAEGTFEVKGLDFGATSETLEEASMTYYIIETTAPAGYVIPADLRKGLPFTVNKDSYEQNDVELHAKPEGSIINNNSQPNIPNTGGIGSIIFVVIGLIVMVLAVLGYKKFA
ncbi:SpaH/EbpB family LPXTG-anchored major pilin [Globicatella sp. HMSC072A10]|uniref:SpaH/EbpB family LPXTG-anchored major pilin n=1 Tax=Globicatella sp. HMSC072A10 TaxID=1739315 RepID=UPI0008D1C361|nr:SpaH/EbpB family LPXTG-anchored major pilin [Globicatella sp. HMSC072A10]OFK55178.1 hypothetical protein HMPREF2811_07815 [Globicatella sp. HMSC072A10]